MKVLQSGKIPVEFEKCGCILEILLRIFTFTQSSRYNLICRTNTLTALRQMYSCQSTKWTPSQRILQPHLLHLHPRDNSWQPTPSPLLYLSAMIPVGQ
jgi:hypothetical protein